MPWSPSQFNTVSVCNAFFLGYDNASTNTGHGNRACGVTKIQSSNCGAGLKKKVSWHADHGQAADYDHTDQEGKDKTAAALLGIKVPVQAKNLLLNAHFQVLILNQVHCHRHHHHHHHVLYHNISVEIWMIAVVIESIQSLGITPYLDLGLLLQVINLLVVIIIMNDVLILVGRWRNLTSIIKVIDISKLLQHLKFQINGNLVLCLHYPKIVSVIVSFACVSILYTFHLSFFCSQF